MVTPDKVTCPIIAQVCLVTLFVNCIGQCFGQHDINLFHANNVINDGLNLKLSDVQDGENSKPLLQSLKFRTHESGLKKRSHFFVSAKPDNTKCKDDCSLSGKSCRLQGAIVNDVNSNEVVQYDSVLPIGARTLSDKDLKQIASNMVEREKRECGECTPKDCLPPCKKGGCCQPKCQPTCPPLMNTPCPCPCPPKPCCPSLDGAPLDAALVDLNSTNQNLVASPNSGTFLGQPSSNSFPVINRNFLGPPSINSNENVVPAVVNSGPEVGTGVGLGVGVGVGIGRGGRQCNCDCNCPIPKKCPTPACSTCRPSCTTPKKDLCAPKCPPTQPTCRPTCCPTTEKKTCPTTTCPKKCPPTPPPCPKCLYEPIILNLKSEENAKIPEESVGNVELVSESNPVPAKEGNILPNFLTLSEREKKCCPLKCDKPTCGTVKPPCPRPCPPKCPTCCPTTCWAELPKAEVGNVVSASEVETSGASNVETADASGVEIPGASGSDVESAIVAKRQCGASQNCPCPWPCPCGTPGPCGKLDRCPGPYPRLPAACPKGCPPSTCSTPCPTTCSAQPTTTCDPNCPTCRQYHKCKVAKRQGGEPKEASCPKTCAPPKCPTPCPCRPKDPGTTCKLPCKVECDLVRLARQDTKTTQQKDCFTTPACPCPSKCDTCPTTRGPSKCPTCPTPCKTCSPPNTCSTCKMKPCCPCSTYAVKRCVDSVSEGYRESRGIQSFLPPENAGLDNASEEPLEITISRKDLQKYFTVETKGGSDSFAFSPMNYLTLNDKKPANDDVEGSKKIARECTTKCTTPCTTKCTTPCTSKKTKCTTACTTKCTTPCPTKKTKCTTPCTTKCPKREAALPMLLRPVGPSRGEDQFPNERAWIKRGCSTKGCTTACTTKGCTTACTTKGCATTTKGCTTACTTKAACGTTEDLCPKSTTGCPVKCPTPCPDKKCPDPCPKVCPPKPKGPKCCPGDRVAPDDQMPERVAFKIPNPESFSLPRPSKDFLEEPVKVKRGCEIDKVAPTPCCVQTTTTCPPKQTGEKQWSKRYAISTESATNANFDFDSEDDEEEDEESLVEGIAKKCTTACTTKDPCATTKDPCASTTACTTKDPCASTTACTTKDPCASTTACTTKDPCATTKDPCASTTGCSTKDPCGTTKDPCADPCATTQDSCGATTKDPCADPCATTKDPCASTADPCATTKDPCATTKDPCAKCKKRSNQNLPEGPEAKPVLPEYRRLSGNFLYAPAQSVKEISEKIVNST